MNFIIFCIETCDEKSLKKKRKEELKENQKSN
jgi:hypothetical protein